MVVVAVIVSEGSEAVSTRHGSLWWPSSSLVVAGLSLWGGSSVSVVPVAAALARRSGVPWFFNFAYDEAFKIPRRRRCVFGVVWWNAAGSFLVGVDVALRSEVIGAVTIASSLFFFFLLFLVVAAAVTVTVVVGDGLVLLFNEIFRKIIKLSSKSNFFFSIVIFCLLLLLLFDPPSNDEADDDGNWISLGRS